MSTLPPQPEVVGRRILVVELEPTPYKTDLWNTFSAAEGVDLFVIYTERKNWAQDGGHNYQKWPANNHRSVTFKGKGMRGKLAAAYGVARQIASRPTDLIYIAGYVHLATVVALFCAILLGRRFVMHADEFNNDLPQGQLAKVRLIVREFLRRQIFKHGDAVLVCGRRGIESALKAGCVREKVRDFPYVIDVERIKQDAPEVVPPGCVEDLERGDPIIFFSGRMIPRKGLETLLKALSDGTADRPWRLWVEGDGPEFAHYQALAHTLMLAQRCRFLGFCQYDVHSWLVRSTDIVVVPSLEDTWGIVVDEGLQLGKSVISSDATGSGYDRINHGHNGYLFSAGDADALKRCLELLIDDEARRRQLGATAAAGPKNLSPQDNLETMLKLANVRL